MTLSRNSLTVSDNAGNADPDFQPETSDTTEIPATEDSMSTDDLSSATDKNVTQAQVYDNLKRIGELEDEKKKIQEEIQNRTEQLREVIGHIDHSSILYRMLESALKDFNPKGPTASSGKKAAKAALLMSPKGSKKRSPRK
jgi:hypothetical protein